MSGDKVDGNLTSITKGQVGLLLILVRPTIVLYWVRTTRRTAGEGPRRSDIGARRRSDELQFGRNGYLSQVRCLDHQRSGG